jgi:hypothetical protein
MKIVSIIIGVKKLLILSSFKKFSIIFDNILYILVLINIINDL